MKKKFIPHLPLHVFLTILLLLPLVLNAQGNFYTDNTGQNVTVSATTAPAILNKDLDTIKTGTELVAPYENAAPLNIYPNPASTTVYLQLPRDLTATTKIDIYNMLGQFMYEATQNPNGLVAIDISRWQQGGYIVRVRNGSTMFTKAFVVNRH